MRLTFLLPWSHRLGGTERSVVTQANHLARRHTVELLTVMRSRARGGFALDPRVRRSHLVDVSGEVPRVASGTDYGDAQALRELVEAPSESFGTAAGRAVNRLAELELEHALRHRRTDLLVTTAPPLLSLAACFASPATLLLHQEHRASEHRRGQDQLLLEAAPRADALVSLTEESHRWLAGSLGSAAPRLEVIPDARCCARPPRAPLDSRLVVTAGRLVPEKQHADMIRAFADVAAERPDWRLRIFGDGPGEAGLRELINELGLYDHVILPGGTPYMEREWAKASIGVLTSRSEGLGLSLIEAAAAGVPSVSYDSPNGPSAVLSDGETGWLVPPGDREALAGALLGLIEDRSERRRLGEAAVLAAQRFAPDEVLPRWDRLLDDLAGGRATSDRLPPRLRRQAIRAREQESVASLAWNRVRGEPPASAAGVEAVHASEPGLILDAGRLWRRLDALPDQQVSQQNLDLVVDAFTRAGIGYFLMRSTGPTRHRVGVPEEHRLRVLEALASAHGGEAVYVTPLLTATQLGEAVLAGGAGQREDLRSAPGLRVNRYLMSSAGTLRFGTDHGCDVEFWQPGGDAVETREPCRRGVEDEIPAAALAQATTVELGGRNYASIEIFTRRTVDEITFPVDAVYTWVDGSDPAWQQRKLAEFDRLGYPGSADAALASRFRSRDELRYSLRSLLLYAPWIRHVYLVTDRQIPPWLDTEHPSLTVVDHTDIFPSREGLPIFNSHALESRLHHIEDLADHYLIINDDVLFGRPTRPQLFFTSSGLAHFFLSRSRIGPGPVAPGTEPAHESARKNTRALLEQSIGRTIRHTFKHTPIPQLRAMMFELEERFPEAFAQNAASKFRNHSDYSLATTLHHYYGYFSGRAIPAPIRYGYFNADNLAHHRALAGLLRRRDRDVLCVNDGHGEEVPEEKQERMLRAFFEAYLPLPCSYERVAGSPSQPAALALDQGDAGQR